MEENLPEPFLGRLIVKVIREDTNDIRKAKAEKDAKATNKVSEEFLSKFDIQVGFETEIDPQTGVKKLVKREGQMPVDKGIIIKKAPDVCGKAFKEKYGDDIGYIPDIGDTVVFIPNGSTRLDQSDMYHTIGDNDIIAYIKAVPLKD